MKVKVGISNRHVHLTEEDFNILFPNENLIEKRPLSQTGQFAAEQTVTIKGPKNEIKNVRILGPFRNYTQVEISKTDSYTLGVKPPIKDSGDLEEATEITIINNDKQITRKCCIIANRHIHITKEEKEKYQLEDTCKVKVDTIKPTILEDVHIKTDPSYVFELHLDTDDGNACFLNEQDEVEIIK